MELEVLLKKAPYLYHLTDQSNLKLILKYNALFSTTELVKMSTAEVAKDYLKEKRFTHTLVIIGDEAVKVRDQKPLNSALGRSLLDNWTTKEWIHHLNKRVFTWPNLNRLRRHYGTYKAENPIILRLKTDEVLQLNNNNVELCRINSGDSRCSAYYDGNPVPRGKDTFKKTDDYEFGEIAEVTFLKKCVLPAYWEIGSKPEGPWKATNGNV